MAKKPTTPKTPEQRARERAEYLGGVNWSFFITAAWGFALAFHALAYFIDGRQLGDRKTAEYLAEAKQREASEN